MDYKLVKPCDDCPFRRKGFIALTPGRVEEIAICASHEQGAPFPCHKTVKEPRRRSEEQQCAGALAFAYQQESPNQMMRIAQRLGMFNPEALEPAFKLVFSNVREMLKGHAAWWHRRKTKP